MLRSKKEFAELCGISQAHLSEYLRKKKVKAQGKGNFEKIDDSIEPNYTFMKRHLASKLQAEKEKVGEVEIVEPVEVERSEPAEVDKDVEAYVSLDQIKKAKDIEKISEEIELLKIKKEKLYGEVIPTSMVIDLISRMTKVIVVEYSNTCDKVITRISKKKKLNNDEVSELRAEIIEEINKASQKAKEESNKDIKTIVNTYSEKRGKGERK